MTAYEFLLSESQERMLFVVKPGSEKELKKLFMKWGLYVEVVGKVLKEIRENKRSKKTKKKKIKKKK